MNASNEQLLIAKLRALPLEKQAEVLDFVEFVSARSRRASLNRLVAIAPALAAANVVPLSDEEIRAEIEAVRELRRQQ